jgi:hypothetical protein
MHDRRDDDAATSDSLGTRAQRSLFRGTAEPKPDPTPCRGEDCSGLVEPVPVDFDRGTRRSWVPGGPHCPACQAAEEASEREAWVERGLRACGLPRRLQGYSLDRTASPMVDESIVMFGRRLEYQRPRVLGVVPQNEWLISELRRWTRRSPWLYLQGPVGTGKSTLAAALAERALRAGSSVAYMPELELFAQLRGEVAAMPRGRSRGGRAAPQAPRSPLVDRLAGVDLLILDDLGQAESRTAFVDDCLDLIVCRRYDAEAPTVLTSNWDLAELGEILRNERLQSRLFQACRGRQKTLEGYDWRTGVRHAESTRQPEPAEPAAAGQMDWMQRAAGEKD